MIKNIPKSIKIILTIIVLTLLCWVTIIIIDMNRTYNLKEPIFASMLENTSNDNNITYNGLGYKIVIESGIVLNTDSTKKQIISVTMYMFNRVIAAAIT